MRTTGRATAALEVRRSRLSSQRLAASIKPASSARWVRRGFEVVPPASWRRTSEANEGSLAQLLRQTLGIMPDSNFDLLSGGTW